MGTLGGDGIWKPRPREGPACPTWVSDSQAVESRSHTLLFEPLAEALRVAAWLTEATKHFTKIFAGQVQCDLRQPMTRLWEGFQKLLCPLTCKPAPPWGSRPTPAAAWSVAWTRTLARLTTGPPPTKPWHGDPREPRAAGRTSARERVPGSAPPSAPRPPGHEAGTTVSFTLLGGFDPKAPLPARSHE